jgi:hypothetical protein
MKKTPVISFKNQKTKLPLLTTIIAYLVLDKFNASPYVWGAVGTLFIIFWIASIVAQFREEAVDIFKENKNED